MDIYQKGIGANLKGLQWLNLGQPEYQNNACIGLQPTE